MKDLLLQMLHSSLFTIQRSAIEDFQKYRDKNFQSEGKEVTPLARPGKDYTSIPMGLI
jgi:hypothetical protein